jgi:hypothetical protein
MLAGITHHAFEVEPHVATPEFFIADGDVMMDDLSGGDVIDLPACVMHTMRPVNVFDI